MAGLNTLKEGRADLSGSHLWEAESSTYNTVTLQQLFPGERLAMITFAHRRLGFYLKAGNPRNFSGVKDLARQDIRFVNRNRGSGTRVYLDGLLADEGIDPRLVQGYSDERRTHSEVAGEVASGGADVGVGLEAAARAFHLDFIFLTLERYDLILRQSLLEQKPVQDLIA